jgi:nucleoid-associated protein YgaU
MEVQRGRRPNQTVATPPKGSMAECEEIASDVKRTNADGTEAVEKAPSGRPTSTQGRTDDVTVKTADSRSAASVAGALIDRQILEKAEQFRAGLKARSGSRASAALARPSGRKHTVAPGETLLDIAQKHGASLLQLVSVNRDMGLGKLQSGQQLELPEVSVAASTRLDIQDACHDVSNYTVKPGDSLWRIAERELGEATRWPEIYDQNREAIDSAARKHGVRPDPTTGYAHWIFPGGKLSLCLPQQEPGQIATEELEHGRQVETLESDGTISALSVRGGTPEQQRIVQQMAAELAKELKPEVREFFQKNFGIDVVELLTNPSSGLVIDLRPDSRMSKRDASGYTHPDGSKVELNLDANFFVDPKYQSYMKQTLLHELAHVARNQTGRKPEIPAWIKERREAEINRISNSFRRTAMMMDSVEGHAVEILQFGRIATQDVNIYRP